MKCYRPIEAFRTPSGVVFQELGRHDILGRIDLPCGQCIGCRERRASDWALRVMHEASLYEDNCAVTLTYDDEHLPPHASLRHSDYKKFMRRVIHAHGPVRFFMCGEYGEEKGRPHYHACLFGRGFRDGRVHAGKSESGSPFYTHQGLSDLWPLGRATVQDLVRETAGYCARYIMKKQLGETAKTAYQKLDIETGELIQLKPPYAAMSLKPGIGARWFEKYGRDVYPHDFVITGGTKKRPPKYYDKLYKRKDAEKHEALNERRVLKARVHHADNTDERLKVQEEVHTARVRTLTRKGL